MDKQDERVYKILDSDKIPDVSDKYVKKYLDYLESKLKFPIMVKGLESPHTGKYKIVGINKNLSDEEYGIIAISINILDKHTFEIPLCDLEVIDKKSKYYQLIEDYSYWYVNNR